MPKIIIDGQEIDCRDGIVVLQAALDAGLDVPHYCYHPGLTVVASCRLCLMEMKMPNPRTQELSWAPKLIPSCQTPVREGMEVRFNSEPVHNNRERVMEYYLLNHPLDCPVCDQAGECWLQDYSRGFGTATSRMVEAKNKNPKKNIGSKTLLYQDRCVMCTRCVRFTKEVTGTGELCTINRGSRAEIDVFPGLPLENKLQGNVVDICPVGALLDKQFLMKQRVWLLKSTESICPGCATGCSIHVDHNQGRPWRLRPRFNPQVNTWWMCDEGRFGWEYVLDPKRITSLTVRRGLESERVDWVEFPEIMRYRLEQVLEKSSAEDPTVGVMLSPFMSNEEAWLLASFVAHIAPQAVFTLGPVPVEGADETFPVGEKDPGKVRFTIRGEKCPNRRGVQLLLNHFGKQQGASAVPLEEFVTRMGQGEFEAAWIVGGYPRDWVPDDLATAVGKVTFLVVQDMFPSKLSASSAAVVPACAWLEREGSFINHDGLVQKFEAALAPPEGAQRDGQYLYALAGHEGLYRGEKVRGMLADKVATFAALHEPPAKPVHAH